MRKLKEILKYRLVPAVALFSLFIVSSALLSSFSGAAPPNNTSPALTPTVQETDPPVLEALPTASPPPPVIVPLRDIIPQLTLRHSSPDYRFMSASGIPFPDYQYGDPVPESLAVDDTFFSDAVFLGDSRTEGFSLYCGLKTADIYAGKSINVINICSSDIISDESGNYVSIIDALGWRIYAKVYIMLGINELGYRPEVFISQYATLVDKVREIQPYAEIYLQAIIPVSQKADSDDSILTNSRISLFNSKIAALAQEKGLYYIDTYSAFLNENGYLPEDASFDGIHLYKEYCQAWLSYLKTHTVLACGVRD
ncbi:MAG: hypothetical protein GX111_08960 [Clostridiales bacterium]|nr:hypothetical protein [Clostridiales bacterium]